MRCFSSSRPDRAQRCSGIEARQRSAQVCWARRTVDRRSPGTAKAVRHSGDLVLPLDLINRLGRLTATQRETAGEDVVWSDKWVPLAELVVIHKFSPRRGRNKSAQGRAQAAQPRSAALGVWSTNMIGRGGGYPVVCTSPRPKPSAVDFGLGIPPSYWGAIGSTDELVSARNPGAAQTLVELAFVCPGLVCCGPFGAKYQARTCV